MTVMPMTRGHIGALAGLGAGLDARLDRRAARMLRLRGILSRLGLFNRVTLTPEGTSARDLCALLDGLHRRGCSAFVLTWHSPSVVPGHTPYVRDAADLAGFLERIAAVCRYVLDGLGGRPGEPWELLPDQLCPVRKDS
jgi:hypothetical protein